jgi:hypothetical protein
MGARSLRACAYLAMVLASYIPVRCVRA